MEIHHLIGTSDRPCWLAEACKILLLLLLAWVSLSAILQAQQLSIDDGR